MIHRLLTCLAWLGLGLLFLVGTILFMIEIPFVPFEYIFFGRDKLYYAFRICYWSCDKISNLEL